MTLFDNYFLVDIADKCRVSLHTITFGTIELNVVYDERNQILEINRGNYHRDNIVRLDLSYALQADYKLIKKYNGTHDRFHQIKNISTMKLCEINIYEGADTILQMEYAFNQDGDSWRSCYGDLYKIAIDSNENNLVLPSHLSVGCLKVMW